MPSNANEKRSATFSETDETENAEGLVLPEILTYDEIDRFLLAVDDIEDLIAFRIMLFGGLRVSEASDVLCKDINPESRSVFVRQGKGSKDRYAPIDIATITLARCYERNMKLKPDDHLFDRETRTLQRHVSETGERAELYVHAHMLRHTCATWQLDKGIPLSIVQNNLGHSDIKVTQIYLHLNIRQRSQKYTDATRFGI
jgi:integrase